jgi:hypothetical protein
MRVYLFLEYLILTPLSRNNCFNSECQEIEVPSDKKYFKVLFPEIQSVPQVIETFYHVLIHQKLPD